MPRLANKFNWGTPSDPVIQEIYRQVTKMYSDIVNVLNTKSSVLVVDSTDPPASSQLNANYDIGDIYVRTDNDTAWMMTSRTTLIAVTWTKIT